MKKMSTYKRFKRMNKWIMDNYIALCEEYVEHDDTISEDFHVWAEDAYKAKFGDDLDHALEEYKKGGEQ